MPIYAMFSQKVGLREESTISTHGSFDHGESTSSKDRLKSSESKYTLPSISAPKVFATHSPGSEAGTTAAVDVEGGLVPERHGPVQTNMQKDQRNLSALEKVQKPADGRRTSVSSSPPRDRRRSLTKLTRTVSRRMSYQTVILELKGEHIKELFWLSNPALYFETVRFFIMLIALYMACWLVDYSGSTVTLMWKVVSILPGVFSTINYLYVVRTAALLKAMYALDFEAADQVFKQIDGCRQLEKIIREKLIAKLNLLNARDLTSDMEARAYKLFCDIDYDHSGVINRHEFSIYLSHMNISLNRKQWKATFRHIDSDANEYISFSEFFVFLYPEHSEARRLERHRLDVIHERVDLHIQHSLENDSSGGGGGGVVVGSPQNDIEMQPSRRQSSTTSNSTWAMLSLSSKVTPHASNTIAEEHVVSVENDKDENDEDLPFDREFGRENNDNDDNCKMHNNNSSSSRISNSNHSRNRSRSHSGFGVAVSINIERQRSSSSSSSDSSQNGDQILPIKD